MKKDPEYTVVPEKEQLDIDPVGGDADATYGGLDDWDLDKYDVLGEPIMNGPAAE